MASSETSDAQTRDRSDPAFDPFRRADGNESAPARLMHYWMYLPLIVVRFHLCVVCIFLCCLVFYLFSPDTEGKPAEDIVVPKWRRRILEAAGSNLSRCVLFLQGFHTVRRIEMPGYDAAEARKATIVSNHVSMIDIILMMAVFVPSYVSKASVRNIPLIGRLGAGIQTIFVDRLKRGHATEQIGARQRRLDEGANLPQLVVWPEGTTTNGKYLLPFKTGTFVAGTPVLPVIVRYPYKKFSPSYESIRALAFTCLLLSQRYNSLEYELHPVYKPSAEERASPELYARNVRSYMAKVGNLELSESTLEDKLEYHRLTRKAHQL